MHGKYTFVSTVSAAISLAVLVLPPFAVSAAGSDLLEALRGEYSLDKNMESDVAVTIWWAVREKEESKSGRILVAAGDRFRVELGDNTWVSDSRTLWQYSARSGQVVIKRLLDIDLSSHPSQILSRYLTDYSYRLVSDDGKAARLEWNADSGDIDSFYRTITMHVDRRKQRVTRIRLVDRNDNISTYSFKKTRFGVDFPADAFTFRIPEGANVLDVRE